VSTTKICTQCGIEYDLSQKFCPADGSPLRLQSPDDPLIGQMVAERYQILSLIGEGGMGRVYLAEHVRMGRRSAVKVINPALATTADAISRFNREAANACKINHPNVAQVYDFGEMADGTLYLAMEYIDGETLDAIVAREGSLPPARAAQITKQVADALFAAHHLGIIHRDLKPENVMIARHLDGSDWVKVVDFGIAKTVQRDGMEGGSQTVTTAGVSLGTPEYMSPEQLAGERLDHRTDIYSLGLVLFNMLTGELPYPKLTSKETLVRRLTSPPRTLAEVRPDIAWPQALQDVLNRGLTPEVKDRYENVGEFGRAVVRAVEDNEPIATAPAAAVAASEAPITRPAPNATVDEGPLARAHIPRRRMLPYVAATLVAVSAGVLILANRPHRSGSIGDDDSLAVIAPVAAPANVSVTPPPALPPQPRPNVPSTAPRRPTAGQASAETQAQARARASVMSDFGQRISDSIQRVIGQIPLAELTRVDSVLARLGPEIERARRAEASHAARLPQRHYWLAPSGDSVDAEPLPPDAPLEARTNVAAQEIRGHIARMQQRFMNHDLGGARREYSSASSELAILRDFDPDLRRTADLQRELALGMRDLLVMCYRMRADSTLSPGVHCENFFGTPGRFREFRQPN
jgi:serine/threonine protein kinase